MSLGLQRFFVVVAVLAVLASGCTGSSGDQIASPTVEPTAAETATVVPTPEPTPTAVVLSDQAILDAALATFEADPQPTDLIAYDLIEVRARGTTGVTEVVVCGWKEDSVFNEIYVVAYRVRQADDGTATVAFESANTISEDCLNTEMVESALQFTRDYEVFWSAVVADPAVFDQAVADQFWTAEFTAVNAPLVQSWIEDSLSFQNAYFDSGLPDSAIAEMLWRSYESGGFEIFEIISCRDLSPNFGLYKGDVLVDDFADDNATGTNAILRYFLVRQDENWRLLKTNSRIRANCFAADDGWANSINRVFSDPTPWERLPT